MKRILCLGILGIAATISANSYGQGGIVIGNYQGAYNPVVWIGGPRAGLGVRSTEGVQLTLHFGPGATLVNSMPLNWDLVNEANGYPGFYSLTMVTLNGWTPGQTWSFQITATENGNYYGAASVVWTENANIKDIGGIPPGPPGMSTQSIGFIMAIPEPTTFAIAALGFAGLIFSRRRK